MKWDRTKRGNVNLVQQYMAAGLSPDAAVEKAYPTWPAAKKQQLAAQMSGAPKTAGYTSELAGTLANPLNWFGVAPLVSGGIALGTPTRSDEEQAEADEETWKNLLIPGVAPYHGWKRLGHILDKKDSEKPDKEEREELEKWQMTAKEDDPDIDEKGRRLKELQDDDAKEKDHVKLGAPRQPWEDSPPAPAPAPSIFNTLSRFIGMNPDRSSPEWAERRRAHIRMSAIRRFAGADTPTIRGQLAGGAIGGLTAGGAAAGGTIGGLYGLLSDPGEDEEGERRSRLVRALKGIAYGGGLGAIGGLLGGAAAGVGANYGGRLGGYISSNLSKETKAGYIGTREKLGAPKKESWLEEAINAGEIEPGANFPRGIFSENYSDVENPLTAFTSQLREQLAHLKDELGKKVKPLLGAGLGAVTGGTLGGLAGGGAAAGSTIGGLYGLLSDPGENKKGERRSRLLRALKGIVYGGGLGALGGLAGGAGAALGGLGGGYTGMRLGYNAFSERSASAMRTTDQDKNAARRVIEKAADIEGHLSSYEDWVPQEYVTSSMLRPPTATNTAIGAGLGGVIGALINYLRKKSPVRGAFTGGLTGAGLAAGSDMAGNVGGGLGYWQGDSGNYGDTSPVYSAIGRQLSSPVGAGLGGLGGYSLAQYLLNRDEKDEEKEAACRVISKVTSLVKDPKKHKWLDDSREGFGHWAGPPSVAKGDTEPKNVKEAQKPLGQEDLDLWAPNNPPPGPDPAVGFHVPPSAYRKKLNFKTDDVPGPRHPGPGAVTPGHKNYDPYSIHWSNPHAPEAGGQRGYRIKEKMRQHFLRKPVGSRDRAEGLKGIDEWHAVPPPHRPQAGPNPNNPRPGGVLRQYEHIYRPRGIPTNRYGIPPDVAAERKRKALKLQRKKATPPPVKKELTAAAKHDCDKDHPGLTHKEWKALKGQRHEIQKNAGVSREALGAILGALLGGAGGYHFANQMAEPGSVNPMTHPDAQAKASFPGNWKEGLIGAVGLGIPSTALGGYIGRALTPRDEEEEEE